MLDFMGFGSFKSKPSENLKEPFLVRSSPQGNLSGVRRILVYLASIVLLASALSLSSFGAFRAYAQVQSPFSLDKCDAVLRADLNDVLIERNNDASREATRNSMCSLRERELDDYFHADNVYARQFCDEGFQKTAERAKTDVRIKGSIFGIGSVDNTVNVSRDKYNEWYSKNCGQLYKRGIKT